MFSLSVSFYVLELSVVSPNDKGDLRSIYVAYMGANRSSADAGAIVPHEVVNARSNGGLDDLEGDDLSYNGANAHGDPSGRSDFNQSTSPQLPSLSEEPGSPSFEGTHKKFLVFIKVLLFAINELRYG